MRKRSRKEAKRVVMPCGAEMAYCGPESPSRAPRESHRMAARFSPGLNHLHYPSHLGDQPTRKGPTF
jgi:hypothetical protein